MPSDVQKTTDLGRSIHEWLEAAAELCGRPVTFDPKKPLWPLFAWWAGIWALTGAIAAFVAWVL